MERYEELHEAQVNYHDQWEEYEAVCFNFKRLLKDALAEYLGGTKENALVSTPRMTVLNSDGVVMRDLSPWCDQFVRGLVCIRDRGYKGMRLYENAQWVFPLKVEISGYTIEILLGVKFKNGVFYVEEQDTTEHLVEANSQKGMEELVAAIYDAMLSFYKNHFQSFLNEKGKKSLGFNVAGPRS